LTRINSIEYPSGASPLSVMAQYSSLRMTGVIFNIAQDMITADTSYTHLIVKIEPTEGSTSHDEVAVNDFVAWPVSIGSSAYGKLSLLNLLQNNYFSCKLIFW